MNDHYIVDLTLAQKRVQLYEVETIRDDLEYTGLKSVDALASIDRHIFRNATDADSFLASYNSTLVKLSNAEICLNRKLPAMLYKRRFIVLALLGLKFSTIRKYRKAWTPGQLFNLHDQTYFLTVRLLSIEELDGGNFKYNYELPK